MSAGYTDLYAVLGVHRTATSQQIKVAYHRLAKAYHPDVKPGDKSAEDMFKRISESYSVLSDASERRGYDMTHAFAGRSGPQPSREWGRDDSARTWSDSSDPAMSAHERHRRAREARATRARVVYDSPSARTDWHDEEEWGRMHYGAGSTGLGGMGGGAKAGPGGKTSAAAYARFHQQAAEARAAQAEAQQYRRFAERFRASRTALDRQLPMLLGAFTGLLLVTYVVTRKLDGG